MIDQLAEKGWDHDAATAVLAFHRDWLEAVKSNDPTGFEATILRLGQLQDPGRVALSDALTKHPELAGLLAMVEDPVALAGALTESEHGPVLAGLFLVHLERDTVQQLAAVLPDDGVRIAGLMRRGLVGGEAIFMAAREGPGGKPAEDAYLKWVRAVLDEGLRVPEAAAAELEEVFLFVLAEGANIRGLCADPAFRARLPARWQTLRQLAGKLREDAKNRKQTPDPDALPGVADLVALPGVWEFASRPDALRLFTARGVLAADLVCGPRTPEKQRDRVAELLLHGDDRVAVLLLDHVGDPAFLPFLEQQVDKGLLSDVAADLGKDPDPAKRLVVLKGKLDAGTGALREAVAPKGGGVVEYLPLYSAYRVATKYAAGDEVSDAELLFAGADVLMAFAPVVKGATVVKAGAKKGATDTAKKEVAKSAAEAAARRIPKPVAKAAGETATKAGLWTALRDSYRKTVQVLRSVIKGDPKVATLTAKVDITAPVKFAFKSLGLKRDRFKRLTGLEARVFMRADARVAIQLHWKIEGKKVRAWLVRFLLREFGRYEVEGEEIPDEVRKTLPPEPPDDPVASRKAAGALFLAALADLLPEAEPK